MTTNIHYLIAGMAVLLVVIWQYSCQRQMDDRNSRMFRRLLSVVSLDDAARRARVRRDPTEVFREAQTGRRACRG